MDKQEKIKWFVNKVIAHNIKNMGKAETILYLMDFGFTRSDLKDYGFSDEDINFAKETRVSKMWYELKSIMSERGAEIGLFDIKDSCHTNCIWYSGKVAEFKYKGFKLVVEAKGSIIIKGMINGSQFDVIADGGKKLYDKCKDILDDDSLEDLLQNTSVKSKNWLRFKDRNWFEINMITPENEYIDLSCCSYNILNNDIVAWCGVIGDYLDLVDSYILKKGRLEMIE